jgi:polyhydroxyalkanoate synthesis regulator phasin
VADEKRNDLLGKLAELSEEAIHRLQDAPGGDRVVGTMNAMKDRLDELQRRVRGIDELETRLSALERKVEKLAKDAGPSTASRATKTKS